MNRKARFIVFSVLGIFLLAGGLLAGGLLANEPAAGAPGVASTPTIITVNSGQDPDDSLSHTTVNNPDGLATLRRAIVEARNTVGPVEIHFAIPEDADEGYDSALGIWKIEVFSTTRTEIFRQLTGDVTIDGSTQPGGRDNGPKIFIYGPTTGMKTGLILGENQFHNNNTVRGIGFQNIRFMVTINSSDNLVEDCWFGLNDAGTEPLLRDGNPASGSGADGVVLQSAANDNIIKNNLFLGLNGTATTLRGRNNTFVENWIGLAADGTVTNPGCTPVNWLGGGGLSVQGRNQTVENNIIAGLRFHQFELSQPPDAISVTVDDVSGSGHIIQNNRIGLDAQDNIVGSCGRGFYLQRNMHGTLIKGNQIYNTSLAAFVLIGHLYNECELSENTVMGTEAVELGDTLPDAYVEFMPPKVTSFNGTTISGTSGDGSPCPNCFVELFMDDTETPVEALEFLGRVPADANGNWTATIPAPLTGNQGIRTTCTTAEFGTIPNMMAGTTRGYSELYTPFTAYTLTVVANPSTGGTASGDGSYAEGAAVNVSAVAAAGYEFNGWTAPAGSFADASAAETAFTMPDQDVTVTANFKEEGEDPVGEGEKVIYVQNINTGAIEAWVVDVKTNPVTNSTITRKENIGTTPAPRADWTITAAHDIDGSGSPDLIWHNSATGARRVWKMDGFVKALELNYGAQDRPSLVVVDLHDMDSDGKPDAVLQNPAGGRFIWFMNEHNLLRELRFEVAAANWNIVGVDDMGADGRINLIWEHKLVGSRNYWVLGNDYKRIDGDQFEFTGDNWKIVAVHDMDGDGKPDLIWENRDNGVRTMWLIDSMQQDLDDMDRGRFAQEPAAWRIVGAGTLVQ